MNHQNTIAINEQTGSVNTLSETVKYQADPLAIFHQLSKNTDNNLLLESAEIDKKHQLKSLLLTDTALKITCHGNLVTFEALSKNGQTALEFAQQQLAVHAELTFKNNWIKYQQKQARAWRPRSSSTSASRTRPWPTPC